ncbi:MAG: DUF4912 domain-containing protein [Elusimicrobia bacterium]|nr:DUF4912 domain-containing protein [Elusimicrobiota bacterium]
MINNQNDTPFGASSGGSSSKGGASREQGYIDRGGPLPEGYGDTLIVLLPRDPQWIFAYWEISAKTRAEIIKKYGANIFQKAKPAIRVYDVTNVNFDGRNANRSFDIFITPESKNWYIYVGMPKRSYCADLGLLVDDGIFITLARSNVVATPAGSVSDIYDEQWMLVKEDFEKLMKLSGIDKIGASSAEALKLLTQRLESVLAVSSKGGSGAGPVRPGKRGFWLIADAELIVYGATEPDALLTVQGKPVKLRPDGTFTLRFAFPDGEIAIPIKAISADTIDSRQIAITAKRKTK